MMEESLRNSDSLMSGSFEIKLNVLEECFSKIIVSSSTCFSIWTAENIYGGSLLVKQLDYSEPPVELKPKLKRQHQLNAKITPKVKKPNVGATPRTVPDPESSFQVIQEASAKVDVSSVISTVQNLKTNEKEFRCSMCQYVAKKMGNARRHVELTHFKSATVFQCLTCGKTSKLKADLKKHYMTVHKMPEHAAKAMLTL